MASKEVEYLKELTARLPRFPLPATVHSKGTEYKLDIGTGIGLYEFENEFLGVHRWLFSKGTVFPKHIHETVEIVYVYEGSVIMSFPERTDPKKVTRILEKGDSLLIPPGMLHSATFYETECKLFSITVPPEQGFPHE